MRVTNGIPLGSPLPLTVIVINHVETLKVPSIEAKVNAAKTRSTTSLMISSDFKLKQQEAESKRSFGENNVNEGVENVAPKVEKLGTESADLINSLLNRASSIDARVAKSPAHSKVVEAGTESDVGDGETTAL